LSGFWIAVLQDNLLIAAIERGEECRGRVALGCSLSLSLTGSLVGFLFLFCICLYHGSDTVFLALQLNLFGRGLVVPAKANEHQRYQYKSNNSVFIHFFCFFILFN
jgi:hypothetical protein